MGSLYTASLPADGDAAWKTWDKANHKCDGHPLWYEKTTFIPAGAQDASTNVDFVIDAWTERCYGATGVSILIKNPELKPFMCIQHSPTAGTAPVKYHLANVFGQQFNNLNVGFQTKSFVVAVEPSYHTDTTKKLLVDVEAKTCKEETSNTAKGDFKSHFGAC